MGKALPKMVLSLGGVAVQTNVVNDMPALGRMDLAAEREGLAIAGLRSRKMPSKRRPQIGPQHRANVRSKMGGS